MGIPQQLQGRLALPAVVSPMFLASGPDLVVESCRAGALGSFPALNCRTTEGLADWLRQIEGRLGPQGGAAAAPYGVNLVVHRSNTRLEADLEVICAHKVPLVITSLGAVPDVVARIHAYGGLVFHDVISQRFARKAAAAGVDGLIAIAAGAGGHAGTVNPFALLAEIRQLFDGCLLLGGALNTGADLAAARMAGADLGYMGTRFLATQEAMISPDFKTMLLECSAADILYTAKVSGVAANFLAPSLQRAGLDPAQLETPGQIDLAHEARAWRDVWSAGHGVGGLSDLPRAADLIADLRRDYARAQAALALRDRAEGFGGLDPAPDPAAEPASD